MFDRFTNGARKAMKLASQTAQQHNHGYMYSDHILMGIVKEENGLAATALKNLGVGLKEIGLEFEKGVKPRTDAVRTGKILSTLAYKKTIELAIEEARSLGHNRVGVEHLLLALLDEQKTKTTAQEILSALGLNLKDIRKEVLSLLGKEDPKKKTKKKKTKKKATPVATTGKEKESPVKRKSFKSEKFVSIGRTEGQIIKEFTPGGSMSDKEVDEAVAEFLKDKKFVMATEHPIIPFRNLKKPLIINETKIYYQDKK